MPVVAEGAAATLAVAEIPAAEVAATLEAVVTPAAVVGVMAAVAAMEEVLHRVSSYHHRHRFPRASFL
jgi:hypothetical protein